MSADTDVFIHVPIRLRDWEKTVAKAKELGMKPESVATALYEAATLLWQEESTKKGSKAAKPHCPLLEAKTDDRPNERYTNIYTHDSHRVGA